MKAEPGSNDHPLSLTLRWVGIALGTAGLSWLAWEDTTVIIVLLLAAAWCVWGALVVYQRTAWRWERTRLLWLGAATGLAVSPTALFFAAVKAGLHDHGFSDYSSGQITIALFSTPGWIGLGLAAAGAFLLLERAKPHNAGRTPPDEASTTPNGVDGEK